MKTIELTQGFITEVDDQDYDYLNQFSWRVMNSGWTCYAIRDKVMEDGTRTTVLMHRELMNTPDGMVTDHINGNGLNNQRYNLRACTYSENRLNTYKTRDLCNYNININITIK